MIIETNSIAVRDFLTEQGLLVNFDPIGDDLLVILTAEEVGQFLQYTNGAMGKILLNMLKR